MSSRPNLFVSRLALVCLVLAAAAIAQTPSHGPAKGYLLITGGATEPRDYQRFVEMAGGKNANIVVIPNASVTKPTSQTVLQDQYCGAKSPFAAFPGVPCTVVFTDDRTVANSAAFVAPIEKPLASGSSAAVTGAPRTPISTLSRKKNSSPCSIAAAPSAEARPARPSRALTWCAAPRILTTTPS